MANTAILQNTAIVGVEIKQLVTHGDDRGFFREIMRDTEEVFRSGHCAQWSHSKMRKNVVKAWHFHHVQIDWWYLPLGHIETVLYDYRPESSTFGTKLIIAMGERKYGQDVKELVIKIPPGVLHGCKVFSEEAHLFYITSETYNTNEEGRYPFNSDIVSHDWGADAITSENDRRTFIPTSTRVLLK